MQRDSEGACDSVPSNQYFGVLERKVSAGVSYERTGFSLKGIIRHR